MNEFKRQFDEMKRDIQAKYIEDTGRSYSQAVKDNAKESIIIVKPIREQESEVTKQVVKEKVDIRNMAVGITKLRKGGKGSIILGCESEREIVKLKDTMSEKLGKDFEVMEPRKMKPKIKVINIGEDEMKLKDEGLIDMIVKQNGLNEKDEGFYIRVIKRINKIRREENARNRRGYNNDGAVILEVDETTQELMLRREKINIGWRRCIVLKFYSVKRCFKCWGYYHLARDCTRQTTCHICAGSHKADECRETKKRCVNCMHKIKMFNVKISDDHDALSVECPTYIRALEEEKKRTGWAANK